MSEPPGVGEMAPSSPGTRIHLSLNVRDLDASVRFYEAFLGSPPHKLRSAYANFAPDRLPLKLALNQLPPDVAGRTALNHLGIQVATVAEVDAARDRITAAKLPVFDEGDTVCCFARQDKFWVHDPDGNAWEVYALTDDMLEEQDRNLVQGSPVHRVPDALTVRGCCEALAECRTS